MNERLEELAEQAETKENGYYFFDREKFAELIIQENAAELRRLQAVNQELLGALHSISLAAQDSGSTREGMGWYARAAIAKATGETK